MSKRIYLIYAEYQHLLYLNDHGNPNIDFKQIPYQTSADNISSLVSYLAEHYKDRKTTLVTNLPPDKFTEFESMIMQSKLTKMKVQREKVK